MKHLLRLLFAVALLVSATAADNYSLEGTRTTGTTNKVVKRATDNGDGSHTDHVVIQSGSAMAAGEAFIGFIGGKSAVASANFTRPSDTTAYASGDLVANSTTAGSVTPLSFTVARIADGTGMIRRVRIKTSSTSVTNAAFRVHFYRTSPTVTNGDNAAWLSIEAGYLGACDVTVDKAFSDAAKGVGAPIAGSEINFLPTSGAQTIFALIEARAAYTPTSAGVFTVEVEVLQN